MARRKVPSAAEAKLMADAEARRLAAAAQQRTRDKERALALVLAEIVKTVELPDEARERLSELMGRDPWKRRVGFLASGYPVGQPGGCERRWP